MVLKTKANIRLLRETAAEEKRKNSKQQCGRDDETERIQDCRIDQQGRHHDGPTPPQIPRRPRGFYIGTDGRAPC